MRIFSYIFFMLAAVAFLGAPAARAQMYDTAAKQAVMIDFDTGAVLFEKNADDRMTPSSMTKVMSLYLVFEALHNGRLSLDAELPVSEKAWKMQGSKMFVEVKKNVPVKELIQGVAVQSGNDACIVLAEGIAGTEESFAEMMNAKAKELGMTGSHFMDASGWPHPEHYSTARDLTVLSAHIIRDFPEEYKFFAETEFTYNNIRQPNRNPLLFRNIGADGIKTGHTEDGGYGLVGSGVQNGRRVVLVINGLESDKARAEESSRLLDWGLRGFENVTLFKAGDAVDHAYVVLGKQEQVVLTLEKDLTVTIPSTLRNDLKVEVKYNGPLEAPVKKGQPVGTLHVEIPRMKAVEVPLTAAADVERLGFFAGAMAKAKILLSGTK